MHLKESHLLFYGRIVIFTLQAVIKTLELCHRINTQPNFYYYYSHLLSPVTSTTTFFYISDWWEGERTMRRRPTWKSHQ